jgi:TonB-linked SusC/RagA family outer membrane protein
MKRIFTLSGLVLLCFFFINTAAAQNIAVKGKVTDAATGETLIGVSVSIKGTSTGTQTDTNGAFSLSAPSNATLQASYIGYTTQEVVVNGPTVDIKLAASAKQLQQVVVVGYGTQRKVDVSGAIATVKGEDLSKQPDPNPVSALQGKVAGVQIVNSGQPGAAPQINIRGIGTVYGNSNPLYVVDGIWFDDISFLNSNDIESMSILKDASSEAIYGIRAANGVVIITTKKGKGAPLVSYNAYVGFSKPTNLVKMADASEYATLVNELNSPTNVFSDPASLGKGTNWYNVVLHNAITQSHNLSISGGTDKSTYNFSLGYFQQDGNVGYGNYDRLTARLQQDVQVYKFLKVGYNAILESNKSHDVPTDITYKAYTAAPVVPVRNADGSYGDPQNYPIGTVTNNPQAELDFYNHHTTNYHVSGNVYAELKITDYLNFRTSFGGDYEQLGINSYTPLYFATKGQQNSANSSLSLENDNIKKWQIENTLTFDKTFAKDHKITVLLGQTALSNQTYNETGTAVNVPDIPDNNYLSLGTSTDRTVTDFGTLLKQSSYFGRLSYAYKDRYSLNASLRYDGSSQFSPSERYGYFPAVGVAWNIINEDFMKGQTVFDNLKLRGSWGKEGNASVPTNLTSLNVNNGFVSNLGGGSNVQTGEGVTTIVPPALFWEKSVGTDIGLETGFLKNRLTFEFDYYNKKTEDAIFDSPILGSLGLTSVNGALSILANQATIQNKGFEFTAGWRGTINNDFSYTINGNFSINSNKVLSSLSGNNPIYGGGNAAPGGVFATRTIVGQPIGEFFGYQTTGIFQTAAQVAASHQPNALPGDFIFKDVNGDGTISSLDRVNLGNPNPKYLYGLNTNFKYKQFDLTIDLQGVAKVSVYNALEGLRYGSENFSQDFYDNRWHGPGTSNTYPSVNIGSTNNSIPNSFFVQDGSYLRVRNLQLGYDLPPSIISKLKIHSIRIYANAQNAIIFTKYKGFSPELTSTSIGGSSATNQGIDSGVYPLYATYNLGLNVTF